MATMTALIEQNHPWFTKDPAIRHPDHPDQAGMSLQDIRDFHLHQYGIDGGTSLLHTAWFVLNPQDDGSLCNVCRHIDFNHILLGDTFAGAACEDETSAKSETEDEGNECEDYSDAASSKSSRRSNYPILLLRHILANRDICRFCRLVTGALHAAHGSSLVPRDRDTLSDLICCVAPADELSKWEASIELGIYGLFDKIYDEGDYDSSTMAAIQLLDVDSRFAGGLHRPPRIQRSFSPSTADLDLVRQWIVNCENDSHPTFTHPEEGTSEDHGCNIDSSTVTDGLSGRSTDGKYAIHLIDVKAKCIVRADTGTRYVVLSYVWGDVDQPRLLQSNYVALTSSGSLAKSNSEFTIPRTVRDAIDLINNLGERFLWVDALCLVQDGPRFADDLNNMHNIYSMAAWCLVAGSAVNANTSIPRLKRHSSEELVFTYKEVFRGLVLAVHLPDYDDFRASSSWDKRAWTYQEGALSRRLVIATNLQFYFSCAIHGYTCSEQKGLAVDELDCTKWGHMHNPRETFKRNNFRTYEGAVMAFMKRQLSFPEDVLKAFAGVLSHLLESFRGDFIFGLPDTELDQALLWFPETSSVRRSGKSGKNLFPSWSWAGWVGPVSYPLGLAVSRVQWKDAITGRYFTSEEFRRPDAESDNVHWHKNSWRKHYPGKYPSFYEAGAPEVLFLHPVATRDVSRKRPTFLRSTSQLHFRALSCHLYISAEPFHLGNDQADRIMKSDAVHELKIMTSSGHYAGVITIPESACSSALGQGKRLEFIRLSIGTLFKGNNDIGRMIESPEDDEFGETSGSRNGNSSTNPLEAEYDIPWRHIITPPFDESVFPVRTPWCVYNVMLIDTEGGVARRVGIGRVHVDAFLGESPVWKQIVLQ